MKSIIISFTVICIFYANHISAQCAEEEALIAKYKKIVNTASSFEQATPASLCKQYYSLVCAAKQDTYKADDQVIKRNQQEAQEIEDKIKKIIKEYSQLSNKMCGDILPVKAIYADSIGVKEENVVGYWLTKEYNNYFKQTHYPIFAFFNGGNFKTSLSDSFKQRSSWKKITKNTYQVTISNYSSFSKKWDSPKTSTFVVHPESNTATYTFTNYKGEKGTSTWYYKGKNFSLYNKSESEILSTKPVIIK